MGRTKVNDDKPLENGELSTPMFTRNTKELLDIESVNKVFGITLVMDNIVKYSIYNSNGAKMDRKTIDNLRLVNKCWLQSTSRVLAKSGKWTISLLVGSIDGVYNSEKGTYEITKPTGPDKFLSVFSNACRSFDSILPINFHILSPYLTEENGENLRNFFEQCGDMISTMDVTYPIEDDSMNLSSIDSNFPILQDFKFHFETQEKSDTLTSEDTLFENCENGLNFFQQILQNSSILRRVTLINDIIAAVNTSSIILPATLKSLKLRNVTESEVTLLTKNRLPNLNFLDLEIREQTEMDLVYNILEHFQQQLTILNMNVVAINSEQGIYINLPLMAKLTCLKISGKDYALSPELRRVWIKRIPNLTSLILENLSETSFLGWVQGSRFENVKNFKFSLKCIIEEDIFYDCDIHSDILSPNVQIIKEIIASFPNVEKLELRFRLNEISGLTYLFQNCTFLKKLNLEFKYEDSDSSPGYQFISVLLGISLELAKALVDGAAKNVNIAVDNPKSIMNLTELNSLTLKTPRYFFVGAQDHFCSQIISKYGLDKMPNLEKIELLDGFAQQQQCTRV